MGNSLGRAGLTRNVAPEDTELVKAFLHEDSDTRKLYEQTYIRKEGLYYSERPTFEEVISRISSRILGFKLLGF